MSSTKELVKQFRAAMTSERKKPTRVLALRISDPDIVSVVDRLAAEAKQQTGKKKAEPSKVATWLLRLGYKALQEVEDDVKT